eukprot:MONOS_3819.1-p1 / transcript=MONOS_3819.1 / gene=MONOS_3819 / organism=Monocercomonoides_exilis_PA203 / gene_product=unspecified product / transcript_product=unspecified product / location=Mono_scaffold00093:128664-132285(-) / protein_length=1140 / sequence_SO=supercontig / SO=protein_coding / is_pseudo=false
MDENILDSPNEERKALQNESHMEEETFRDSISSLSTQFSKLLDESSFCFSFGNEHETDKSYSGYQKSGLIVIKPSSTLNLDIYFEPNIDLPLSQEGAPYLITSLLSISVFTPFGNDEERELSKSDKSHLMDSYYSPVLFHLLPLSGFVSRSILRLPLCLKHLLHIGKTGFYASKYAKSTEKATIPENIEENGEATDEVGVFVGVEQIIPLLNTSTSKRISSKIECTSSISSLTLKDSERNGSEKICIPSLSFSDNSKNKSLSLQAQTNLFNQTCAIIPSALSELCVQSPSFLRHLRENSSIISTSESLLELEPGNSTNIHLQFIPPSPSKIHSIIDPLADAVCAKKEIGSPPIVSSLMGNASQKLIQKMRHGTGLLPNDVCITIKGQLTLKPLDEYETDYEEKPMEEKRGLQNYFGESHSFKERSCNNVENCFCDTFAFSVTFDPTEVVELSSSDEDDDINQFGMSNAKKPEDTEFIEETEKEREIEEEAEDEKGDRGNFIQNAELEADCEEPAFQFLGEQAQRNEGTSAERLEELEKKIEQIANRKESEMKQEKQIVSDALDNIHSILSELLSLTSSANEKKRKEKNNKTPFIHESNEKNESEIPKNVEEEQSKANNFTETEPEIEMQTFKNSSFNPTHSSEEMSMPMPISMSISKDQNKSTKNSDQSQDKPHSSSNPPTFSSSSVFIPLSRVPSISSPHHTPVRPASFPSCAQIIQSAEQNKSNSSKERNKIDDCLIRDEQSNAYEASFPQPGSMSNSSFHKESESSSHLPEAYGKPKFDNTTPQPLSSVFSSPESDDSTRQLPSPSTSAGKMPYNRHVSSFQSEKYFPSDPTLRSSVPQFSPPSTNEQRITSPHSPHISPNSQHASRNIQLTFSAPSSHLRPSCNSADFKQNASFTSVPPSSPHFKHSFSTSLPRAAKYSSYPKPKSDAFQELPTATRMSSPPRQSKIYKPSLSILATPSTLETVRNHLENSCLSSYHTQKLSASPSFAREPAPLPPTSSIPSYLPNSSSPRYQSSYQQKKESFSFNDGRISPLHSPPSQPCSPRLTHQLLHSSTPHHFPICRKPSPLVSFSSRYLTIAPTQPNTVAYESCTAASLVNFSLSYEIKCKETRILLCTDESGHNYEPASYMYAWKRLL